jgi:hypothetical protein
MPCRAAGPLGAALLVALLPLGHPTGLSRLCIHSTSHDAAVARVGDWLTAEIDSRQSLRSVGTCDDGRTAGQLEMHLGIANAPPVATSSCGALLAAPGSFLLAASKSTVNVAS